jgi:hypothetical protein
MGKPLAQIGQPDRLTVRCSHHRDAQTTIFSGLGLKNIPKNLSFKGNIIKYKSLKLVATE